MCLHNSWPVHAHLEKVLHQLRVKGADALRRDLQVARQVRPSRQVQHLRVGVSEWRATTSMPAHAAVMLHADVTPRGTPGWHSGDAPSGRVQVHSLPGHTLLAKLHCLAPPPVSGCAWTVRHERWWL